MPNIFSVLLCRLVCLVAVVLAVGGAVESNAVVIKYAWENTCSLEATKNADKTFTEYGWLIDSRSHYGLWFD